VPKLLGLTLLGALLPGLGLIVGGRRRIGAFVLTLFLGLVGLGVYVGLTRREQVLAAAVVPSRLLTTSVLVGALAFLWIVVIVASHRSLRPATGGAGGRALGAGFVGILCFAIAAPAAVGVQTVLAQRTLVQDVFQAQGESKSATRPTTVNVKDPWEGKPRLNLLLLGGDDAPSRQGVRTDTVIVASIDTDTGATTTFSLPRNLEELPFPEDSPLHDVYPHGFDVGVESESLLNAVYRNGPAANPDILGPTDNPGADFLKLGVGEALGLTIDYYVLVNLDGFSQLIDALGGITVNVNYYVPIGGEPSLGYLPDAYIAPGPNQHMDGERALNYARGRFGLSDYLRMDRQRCMINAIVSAADPMTLLSRYQQIAATTQDIVSTDIPQAVVGDFADLALKVKDTGIQSVVFDDSVIRPAYPDYDKIRSMVQDALSGPAPAPAPTAPAGGAATNAGGAGTPDTGTGTTDAGTVADASGAGSSPSPVENAADACAYDPVAAQEALAEGQPPTKNQR
jgi:LCP family protein required for cell wall assembly